MLINCCLIFVNYFEPCLFRTLFHRGLEKEEVNTVSFGLIIPLFSCCSADNLSESLSQSLILSEVLLALLFPVSPSWCIFAQVQGEELNFSFQYLPHCSGGDVVHNSRFSHLIYSLNPPSLFFFFPISLIPSLSLAGSKRLIWDRQTSPALCPTSALSSLLFLLIPFPPSFTSIHLSLSDSLRLGLY